MAESMPGKIAHARTFDGDIVYFFETRALARPSVRAKCTITLGNVGSGQLVSARIDGFERKFRCDKPRICKRLCGHHTVRLQQIWAVTVSAQAYACVTVASLGSTL